MTRDEALRLALDALEYIENNYMSLPKVGIEAIKACKEALARPAALGLIESLKDAQICCGEYETCWAGCTPRGKFFGQREHMTEKDWTPEEEEAFNAIEKQSNLGKQILQDMKLADTPTHIRLDKQQICLLYTSPSPRD